jgi:hypothetical protein
VRAASCLGQPGRLPSFGLGRKGGPALPSLWLRQRRTSQVPWLPPSPPRLSSTSRCWCSSSSLSFHRPLRSLVSRLPSPFSASRLQRFGFCLRRRRPFSAPLTRSQFLVMLMREEICEIAGRGMAAVIPCLICAHSLRSTPKSKLTKQASVVACTVLVLHLNLTTFPLPITRCRFHQLGLRGSS